MKGRRRPLDRERQVAPEASIAIIAARILDRYGVANARPATNADQVTHNFSWSWIQSLPDPVDLFDLSTETEHHRRCRHAARA